jgi:hypothetical protein
MNDISDLSSTIKPKSDQLNADDLLIGPMDVTITDIKSGPNDQPVHIYIEGQQPYKPCKTMRRVLITAWGSDGKAWIGKSMTLYCDPTVKFGGIALGGIRISHLSHIDQTLNMMLTATRGRKTQVVVKPLELIDILQVAIESGYSEEEVCNTFNPPLKSINDVADKKGCVKFLRDNSK